MESRLAPSDMLNPDVNADELALTQDVDLSPPHISESLENSQLPRTRAYQVDHLAG